MLANVYCYILYDQALKKKIEPVEENDEKKTVYENFFEPDSSLSQITEAYTQNIIGE